MRFFDLLKNRTKLFRKRSIHRMKIGLKYYLDRRPKDPVFIVASRRTGSNLLVDYLQSIPGISFQSEILNARMFYGIRSRFISKKAVLRHMAHSIHYNEHRICGAKLILKHMQTHGIVLDDLKSIFPSVKFIILYRQSILDQFISLKIAEKTNVWQWIDNGFVIPDSIDVDVWELNAFREEIKAFYKNIFAASWVMDRSVVISYEELVADSQGLFDRIIFPFLGLPASKISSITKKQNYKKPSEIVAHYEAIKNIISEESLKQDYSR